MGKIGDWIVDNYRFMRKKCGRPPVDPERIRQCRKLYPAKNAEACLRKRDGKLAERVGSILIVGTMLFFFFRCRTPKPEPVLSLKRPGCGTGVIYYDMEVKKEDGERISVEIPVEDRAYTEAEMEEKFEEAYEEILQRMPGENDSLSHVTSSLLLPQKALGGLIRVAWTSGTRELFDDWGEIVKSSDEIKGEGEDGFYLAEFSGGGYSREYEIAVRVYPQEQTETEMFSDALIKTAVRYGNNSKQSEAAELPEEYKGERLEWYEKQESGRTGWFLFFPVAAAVFVIAREKQGQKERLREREKEMLMDYPELLAKFTVLIQAGMTTRNVWERMVKEYEEKKKKGAKPRYAYEEMKITLNQLKNSMYESQAYAEFGRRCGLHPYLKFGALLEQNLKNGTTGLSVRLRKEAQDAFEERKILAKRLGEEAQTKLMLPMFMMLIMVLVVIMVPAFLAF